MSSEQATSGGRNRREFLKAGGAVTAALLSPVAIKADTAKTMPPLPVNR